LDGAQHHRDHRRHLLAFGDKLIGDPITGFPS
jgi:hypothetical protein